MKRCCTVLMVLLLPACAPAQTAPAPVYARADTTALHRTLDSLATAHRGVLGYSVNNIDTGERISLRGDETFPTASLIKVSILTTLYDLVEKGQLSLADPIRVLKSDKVPGSGQLQFMHDGIEITLADAAWLMITLSDNTATNVLLDKVAMRRVWDKMEALGLKNTKVHSKSFQRFTSVAMDSSVKYGLGVTTPNEMARLFELIANGKAVSPASDSAMMRFLDHNTDDLMLARFAGIGLAKKSGAGDQIRTECALFRLQSRVVVCALTKDNQDRSWRVDNEAQVTIARIGESVAHAWPKRTPPRQ